MEPPRQDISRHVVELQLLKIVSSAGFARSARAIHLLRYLVESTLDDSSHLLKEYVVAVEGLGLKADFDTRLNSVVRVEASRLRKRLHAYYESEGAHDSLVISLPRGGYQVRIDSRHEPTRRHQSGAAVGDFG